MDVHLRNLESLFGVRIRYEMPEYQRDYVWEQFSQWEPLWADVKATAEAYLERATTNMQEHKKHFLGPIIVTRGDDSVSDEHGMVRSMEVIDGQQRLTTLQLLIHAACESIRHEDPLNAKRLQEHIVNAEHTWKNGDSQFSYKVWSKASTTDRSAFIEIMSEGDSEQTDSLIVQAYKYFLEEINSWLDEAKGKDDEASRSTTIERSSSSQGNRVTAGRSQLSSFDELPMILDEPPPQVNGFLTSYCDALRQTLLGLITVVVIESGDDYDANVIYETLNSRGTSLDLWQRVKNLLLTPHPAFETEGEWFTEQDTDAFWDRVDDDVFEEQKHSHTDNLLRHYINIRSHKNIRNEKWGPYVAANVAKNSYASKDAVGIYAPNAANGIYNEYKELIAARSSRAPRGSGKPTSPQDTILAEVARVATMYKSIEQAPNHNYLFLKRIVPSVFIGALLLLAGKEKDRFQFEKGIDALASFIARRRVAGKRTTEIEMSTLTSQLIIELSRPRGGPLGDRIVNHLKNIYRHKPTEWPDDARFAKSLGEYSIYRSSPKVTRVILQGLEVRMRIEHNELLKNSGSTALSLNLPAHVASVEHIMPQKWSEYWTTSDGEQEEDTKRRNSVVHTIGNLTLVTADLNRKLANQQWDRKKELIKNDESSNDLLLNQHLTDSTVSADWYEEAIWARSKALIEIAQRHWQSPNSPRWQNQ